MMCSWSLPLSPLTLLLALDLSTLLTVGFLLPQEEQTYSHLRVFAFAFPSSLNGLSPDTQMAHPHKAHLGHTTKNYTWSPNTSCIFHQVSSFPLQYLLPFDMTHFGECKFDHGRAFECFIHSFFVARRIVPATQSSLIKSVQNSYSTIMCLKSFWLFKDTQVVLCSGGCGNTEIIIFLPRKKC